MRQIAIRAASLIVMVAACGRSKTVVHPDAADASADAAKPSDLGSSSDSSDAVDVSDTVDSSDATDVSDADDASDACLPAGAQTQSLFSKDCCQGLVATQVTNASGAPIYACVTCVDEGQLTIDTFGFSCCPGLVYIRFGSGPPPYPNCHAGIDPPGVCSRCGNGICEDWERPCGCPQDCDVDGATPDAIGL
jgi:hypothetical protein